MHCGKRPRSTATMPVQGALQGYSEGKIMIGMGFWENIGPLGFTKTEIGNYLTVITSKHYPTQQKFRILRSSRTTLHTDYHIYHNLSGFYMVQNFYPP